MENDEETMKTTRARPFCADGTDLNGPDVRSDADIHTRFIAENMTGEMPDKLAALVRKMPPDMFEAFILHVNNALDGTKSD